MDNLIEGYRNSSDGNLGLTIHLVLGKAANIHSKHCIILFLNINLSINTIN